MGLEDEQALDNMEALAAFSTDRTMWRIAAKPAIASVTPWAAGARAPARRLRLGTAPADVAAWTRSIATFRSQSQRTQGWVCAECELHASVFVRHAALGDCPQAHPGADWSVEQFAAP